MPCLWPGEHASQAQPKYGKAFCRMRNFCSQMLMPQALTKHQTSRGRVATGVLVGFLWGSRAGFCRITVVSFQLLFCQLFLSETQLFMVSFGSSEGCRWRGAYSARSGGALDLRDDPSQGCAPTSGQGLGSAARPSRAPPGRAAACGLQPPSSARLPVAEGRPVAFRGAHLHTAAGGDRRGEAPSPPRFLPASLLCAGTPPRPATAEPRRPEPGAGRPAPARPRRGAARHGTARRGGRTCPRSAHPPARQAPPPPPPPPPPPAGHPAARPRHGARLPPPTGGQRCRLSGRQEAAGPPRIRLPLGMSSGSPGGHSGASGGGGGRRRRRRRRRGGAPGAATFAGGCRGGRCSCSQRRQEQHVPRCRQR